MRTSCNEEIPKSGTPRLDAATPPPDKYMASWPSFSASNAE